ncbi:hypothetical protein LWP59_08840 [Amycolatopsis acidiphila]|uniref:Alkylhydroperoxidase AhpD family core domain-containing protein n=1 Tax=Amycolatopsis acidiphila TaxID=715473 RepID=A0A558A510_9PSEU|nr:hypothetical protein [Amycolatopsis acidiphila]TVT19345.1 hypothetical protein FNH06_24620 [Amycolatopsis acidiphila]UIJ61711.1 hypothetical protein LWP59_08840 [Amycolatopsis acidiphila]GHG58281.1 hypothetical protein GCM10017788_10800 [Amycolatopsis acidiphila]
MRLSILDHGHRRRAKAFIAVTAKLSRVDSPDIVKMLLYRPDFLTGRLLDLTAAVMRGPSYWTAAEREYLAMSIAQRHQCPFCIVTHAELTRIAGAGEVDPDDPASVRPELREVREFLETHDARVVAGLPRAAVLAALQINVVWDIVNRLANAFGFELRDGQLSVGTRALHRSGYRFPGFLLAGGEHADSGDPVENLRHAALDAPAMTDPALRAAAATGEGLEEPWLSYTAIVRDASYRLTDSDLDRLREAGHSENEIFEVTVAAAVGAALRTFTEGRDALLGAADEG